MASCSGERFSESFITRRFTSAPAASRYEAVRLDRVERKIALTGDLSPAERKRLLEIAEMCPVHRTLESGSTVVVSSLVDA